MTLDVNSDRLNATLKWRMVLSDNKEKNNRRHLFAMQPAKSAT